MVNSLSRGFSRTSSKTSSGCSPRPQIDGCDGPYAVGHPMGCARIFKQTGEFNMAMVLCCIQGVIVLFKFLRFHVQFMFSLGTCRERRHESIVRDFMSICWDQKCHLSNWWPYYCSQMGGATMQIRVLSSFIQWAWPPGDHTIICRFCSGGGICQISQLGCP